MLKVIKILITTIGFLQIVIGPTIIGLLLGYLIYNSKTDNTGLIIAIGVATLGLIDGLIWAIKVSKRTNPADYVSRIRASPDLDKKDADFFNRP